MTRTAWMCGFAAGARHVRRVVADAELFDGDDDSAARLLALDSARISAAPEAYGRGWYAAVCAAFGGMLAEGQDVRVPSALMFALQARRPRGVR